MKKIALIRGSNLNKWEVQCFTPLKKEFEFTAFSSWFHNFDISNFPIVVKKLPSIGQMLRMKLFKNMLNPILGNSQDLIGLEKYLNDYHIIHSAEISNYYTYQAAIAKVKNNSKLIITVWENLPFANNNPKSKIHKDYIFKHADLFLPVTERAKEVLILEGAPSHKVKVLMPGINTNHFQPMPKDATLLQKFGCSLEDTIILFVANLYWEKGIFDLIFAYKKLINECEGEKIKLLIAGKGKEKNNIENTIRDLNLTHRIKLIGSYDYNNMPRIHNLADIFVLPSIPTPRWQEQFGYVLIESMACGKPIISTSCGSIPEVIGDAGIIIPPNDFLSLTSAIKELMIDINKSKTLGIIGRKRAESFFNSDNISAQFDNIYKSFF